MAKTAVLVPGSVLKGLLDSYHIPVAKISEDIGLSPSAIRQLINNKLKISIIIALRLAKYFDKKAEYWIDLQTSYELSQLQKDPKTNAALKAIPKAKKLPAPAPKKAAKAPAAKRGSKGSVKKPGRKPAAKKVADKKPRKPRTPKAKPAASSSTISS
jgi:addiction module HigA family antidote